MILKKSVLLHTPRSTGPMPKPYVLPSGDSLLKGVVDDDTLRALQERNEQRSKLAREALGAAYCCAPINSPTRNN